MSDYLEAVGPVCIEPFDFEVDTEAFQRAAEQAAIAYARISEDLAAAFDRDVATVGQILRDALADVDGSLDWLSCSFSDESLDETDGMTIDELIPGIDSQLAEWRKVRDE